MTICCQLGDVDMARASIRAQAASLRPSSHPSSATW
jgi:hypothetical protein